MERVGVRELRQKASELLRRVAAGETFVVTDRGRPAAILSAPGPVGLAELERRGLIRRGEGDLLRLDAVRMPAGKRRPSDLVNEGRGT
ncbi:MAG TPA: type II toxin-antitoxin system prevent-host-death family antitoxin [Candidatus Limnocylindria bacterium]|jgi:prevent-host-death family protein|nr:type II toxin-antitoxin system prevent-host-death family antitoxin [Candidatus Limnocylindria bacterium]